MRFVFLLIGSLMIGFMIASFVRNTEWMRERQKRIYGWFCRESGGTNFRMEGSWIVHCDYTVDKKGKIIRP